MTREQDVIDRCHKKFSDIYLYSMVDFRLPLKEKQYLICRDHGPFLQSLERFLSKTGGGCPKCGRKRAGVATSIAKKITSRQYIEDCISRHGQMYSYTNTVYEGALKHVTVQCPCHGDFKIRADRHRSGRRCQKCEMEVQSQRKRITQEGFVARSKAVHEITYDYSKSLYRGTAYPVIVTCPEHGDFEQNAGHHMRGSDCPRCTLMKSSSAIATRWLQTLGIPDMQFEFPIPNTTLIADGYAPALNTVYLFHGDYWHGNPQVFKSTDMNPTVGKTFGHLYRRTKQLEGLIRSQGYDLIVMWEHDWKITCR